MSFATKFVRMDGFGGVLWRITHKGLLNGAPREASKVHDGALEERIPGF